MVIKTQILNFDSVNSNYLSNIPNTANSIANPYVAQYAMNQNFQKVKKVYLKSVELPVGFCNIRGGSTDNIRFQLNGSNYMVYLLEKNYDTITALMTDLNTACVGIVPNVTMTFSLNTSVTTASTKRLIITFTGTVKTTSFTMLDTNLSKYVLGFRTCAFISAGSTYVSLSSNYNLNYDNYINMYIPTLPCLNPSMNNLISTFKIPLNTIYNQIYFYAPSQSTWVDITDSNFQFTNITVILTDRFGNNINPNGLDYSFSLTLEYEY